MPINTGAPLNTKGRYFDFLRQYKATALELKTVDENSLPDGYEVYCGELGGWYEFQSSNDPDEETGKFRPRQGGGGGLPANTTLGRLKNVANSVDLVEEKKTLLFKDANSDTFVTDSSVFDNLDKLMQAVFPFTVSYFRGGGTYEKGSSQYIGLSWDYDREVTEQDINGRIIDPLERTTGFDKITTNTTFTLTAKSQDLTATAKVTANFQLRKYYGPSEKEYLTNTDIIQLTSAWASRALSATEFDCTGGKYPYYILPTSLTPNIQFWIGGLRNTDWNEEVIDVTNASGYTENYTIFRLNNIQTGILSIEVR